MNENWRELQLVFVNKMKKFQKEKLMILHLKKKWNAMHLHIKIVILSNQSLSIIV